MPKSDHNGQRVRYAHYIGLHIAGRCGRFHGFEPTDEYPGSPEKIKVLGQRYKEALHAGIEPSLCHAEDAKLPLGMGWRFHTEPNGRVPSSNKTLVPEDQANAREIASRETVSVLELVRKMVGKEPVPCPARAS